MEAKQTVAVFGASGNMGAAITKSIAKGPYRLVGLHPMGRLGNAEELAELALWLNSDKASL